MHLVSGISNDVALGSMYFYCTRHFVQYWFYSYSVMVDFISIGFVPIQKQAMMPLSFWLWFSTTQCCNRQSNIVPWPADVTSVALIPVHTQVACGMWHIYSNISTAQYFGANIVLISISTALTVLVLNIHHRGSRGNPVPAMVQKVVLDWLARILGMGKCVPGKNKGNLNGAKSVRVNSRPISIKMV